MPDNKSLDYQKINLPYVDNATKYSQIRLDAICQLQKNFAENQMKEYSELGGQSYQQIRSCSESSEILIDQVTQTQVSLKQEIAQLTSTINDNTEKNKTISSEAEQKFISILETIQGYESTLKILDEKRKTIIDKIDTKILYQLESPSRSNKNGELFNWILGCLFGEKQTVNEFLNKRGYQMSKASQTCFVLCGTKKQVQGDPWILFKNEVFHKNNGIELLNILKKLNSQNIQEIQLMLIEELLEDKKDIIRSQTILDQKFQVRLIFDLLDLLMLGKDLCAKIVDARLGMEDHSEDNDEKKRIKRIFEELKHDHTDMMNQISNFEETLQEILISAKNDYNNYEDRAHIAETEIHQNQESSTTQSTKVESIGNSEVLTIEDEKKKAQIQTKTQAQAEEPKQKQQSQQQQQQNLSKRQSSSSIPDQKQGQENDEKLIDFKEGDKDEEKDDKKGVKGEDEKEEKMEPALDDPIKLNIQKTMYQALLRKTTTDQQQDETKIVKLSIYDQIALSKSKAR